MASELIRIGARLLPVLVCYSLLFTSRACAQLAGGAEGDFNSRYVWRGLAYSEGPVLQGNAWLTYGDLTVNGWGNYVLTDEPQQGTVNSVSASVVWTQDLKGFRLEPMVEYWGDRHIEHIEDPATGELSMRISHATGPIRVFLMQAVDLFSFRGASYGETGISKNFTRYGFKTDVSTRISWGNRLYNETYTGIDRTSLQYVGADITSTYQLREHLYIRPHVEWSFLLDSDLRRILHPASTWNAGIALGTSF